MDSWVVQHENKVLIRDNGVEIFFGEVKEMPENIRKIYEEFNYIPTIQDWEKLLMTNKCNN